MTIAHQPLLIAGPGRVEPSSEDIKIGSELGAGGAGGARGAAVGAEERPHRRAYRKGHTKILETLVELDPGSQLPDGLRVDALIVPSGGEMAQAQSGRFLIFRQRESTQRFFCPVGENVSEDFL